MSGFARGILATVLTGVVALAVVSMLGVASAEAPTGSTSARTLSVEGVGTLPVESHDSAAAATAVYREGMAKALVDGQSKAAFLAEKSGAALGAVVSIVEGGGYIECTGTDTEYAEYEGEQPDFGQGVQPSSVSTAAPEAATSPAKEESASRVSHKPKRKKKHAVAKKSSVAASCTLTANVSLVYAIG
jgi:predicted RecA/RadA family phage recombinase